MNDLEGLTKLPKWAQRHYAALQRRIEGLEHALAQYAGEEDSPIRRLVGLEQRPVPSGAIRFTFPGTWRHVDIRVVGNHLDVNGSSQIGVHPMAANHVEISLGGTW